jgi:hypothetical protein
LSEIACPGCGIPRPASATFCSNCGRDLRAVGGGGDEPGTNAPLPSFSTRPPLAAQDTRSYTERYRGTPYAGPAPAAPRRTLIGSRASLALIAGGFLLLGAGALVVLAVALGVIRPGGPGLRERLGGLEPVPTALPTPTPTPAPTGVVPDAAEIGFCLAAYEVERVNKEWEHLVRQSIVAKPGEQPGIRTEIGELELSLAEIRPAVADAARWEPAAAWSKLLDGVVDRLATSLRLLRAGLDRGDPATIRRADEEVTRARVAYAEASAEGARLVLQYPEIACEPA